MHLLWVDKAQRCPFNGFPQVTGCCTSKGNVFALFFWQCIKLYCKLLIEYDEILCVRGMTQPTFKVFVPLCECMCVHMCSTARCNPDISRTLLLPCCLPHGPATLPLHDLFSTPLMENWSLLAQHTRRHLPCPSLIFFSTCSKTRKPLSVNKGWGFTLVACQRK